MGVLMNVSEIAFLVRAVVRSFSWFVGLAKSRSEFP